MFGFSLAKITLAIQGNLAYAGEGADFLEACLVPHKVKEGSLYFLHSALQESTGALSGDFSGDSGRRSDAEEKAKKIEGKLEILREVWQRGAAGVVAGERDFIGLLGTGFRRAGCAVARCNDVGRGLGEVIRQKVPGFSCALVLVENPLKALRQLAYWQRNVLANDEGCTCRVLVFSGGAGRKAALEKTAVLLREKGSVLCSWASHHPERNIPLKILELRPEHRALLVEIGEQELSDGDYFYRLCRPVGGVITEFTDARQVDLFAHLPYGGALVLNTADRRALRPWLINIRSPLAWFETCPDEEDDSGGEKIGSKVAGKLAGLLGISPVGSA